MVLPCVECLEVRTMVCAHCSDRIWNDDVRGDANTNLCSYCFEHSYTYCERCGKFHYTEYSGFGLSHWWDYSISKGEYIDDLKAIATYYGCSPDDVDELLASGFTPEEVEEYLYCTE